MPDYTRMYLLTQENDMLTRLGSLEILFPLDEELVLLFVVAGFAAGDEIAFGATATAD